MTPASGKVTAFHKEDNQWFSDAGLPTDITITVDGVMFHLHKFPLVSKCGKIARLCEESPDQKTLSTELEDFPGGPDAFLIAFKFCYGTRVELTPRNIVMVYCAADYLEMTDELGEGNLVSKSESFLHKNVLQSWKDCILALRSCDDPVLQKAEKLNVITKCLNAVSLMASTDPSLFGWPMMMYGRLQSPGGSILWNGINTGARIRSAESDWWFEDVSYLNVSLFARLIKVMEIRGIRPENLAGAIMYYARKYLPGLGRWQSGQISKTRTVTSFSLTPTPTPAAVDEKDLLETVEKLLPERKGKSFCRFLLGLLRVALILGVSQRCIESLEKRIGMQLELASLDVLLIPNYSDSDDTLYNTDCIHRVLRHFIMSSESGITPFSPASLTSVSPSSEPLRKVAKLMDNYLAEVASDVNLKPGKIRLLAEALPDSSRTFHDGLYRALDIYFKAHPWLSEREKEELCNIIDYQKLSIDAYAHASQNERLPLRIVLQVLFFEQIQLRRALAGPPPIILPTDITSTGQIVERDGWETMVRQNQVLKLDLENMRCRVGELEEEFNSIKQEMRKVTKSHSSLSSPRFGCKLLPRPSDSQPVVVHADSNGHRPRASVEQPHSSRHFPRHRKSFSLV